jgi:hypothetical protein
MLNWFFENRIRAAEHTRGVPLDYLRYIAQHSTGAMFRLARFVRLSQYRSPLAVEALAVAGRTRRRPARAHLPAQGDRGLIDPSMAVAMHRVYPTLKRALGYAKSCTPVTLSA